MMSNKLLNLITKLESRGLPRLWPPYSPFQEVTEAAHLLSPNELFTKPVKNPEMAACVVSGLLLWADALEDSHRLSQEIPNTTGSWWHGIMHRREPDYSNSRYWFGRVGTHPAFDRVYQASLHDLLAIDTPEGNSLHETISGWGKWNPEAFISMVERLRSQPEHHPSVVALEVVQKAEILTLLKWCAEQATA